MSTTLESRHYDALHALLGAKGIVTDPLVTQAKCADWRGRYQGRTPFVLLPGTVEECARAVRYCADNGLAVLPQGGNTGLVGGSTPQGEVLISTDRLRTIRAVEPADAALTVEAGVPLQAVQDAAREVDALFPLSLGSQGTATIGGLISTNAGGVAVLRYGMMRDLVLGLEVVLPDGRIWNGLRSLRKDNTGYDLKQLFIGAEGTLGIITAATLKLFPQPQSQATAMLALDRVDAAPELLRRAQHMSGGAVTAFELIPRRGLDLVLQHIPDTRDPLSTRTDWLILMELSLARGVSGDDLMQAVLEDAFESGLITDAALAGSDAQARALWQLRETLPEAERAHGKAIKHDVSVPVRAIPALLSTADQAVRQVFAEADIIAFGHVGDGNIHYNVGAPAGAQGDLWARADAITAAVHDAALSLEGSISAEHGIGILKKADFAARHPLDAELMARIRAALDPQHVMNPRVIVDY